MITLWNPVDEKVVPMEERWYRKIYSFCKGSKAVIRDRVWQSWFYSFWNGAPCLDLWRGVKVHGRTEDEPGEIQINHIKEIHDLRELSDNKDIPGRRHLHDDPKEILGRPDDTKTKELPLHLLVQPTLHWWFIQCHWKRWHSGNCGLFIQFNKIKMGC